MSKIFLYGMLFITLFNNECFTGPIYYQNNNEQTNSSKYNGQPNSDNDKNYTNDTPAPPYINGINGKTPIPPSDNDKIYTNDTPTSQYNGKTPIPLSYSDMPNPYKTTKSNNERTYKLDATNNDIQNINDSNANNNPYLKDYILNQEQINNTSNLQDKNNSQEQSNKNVSNNIQEEQPKYLREFRVYFDKISREINNINNNIQKISNEIDKNNANNRKQINNMQQQVNKIQDKLIKANLCVINNSDGSSTLTTKGKIFKSNSTDCKPQNDLTMQQLKNNVILASRDDHGQIIN